MPRGGKREGAGGKPKWKNGKTKTVRLPEDLIDQILQYAHNLDSGAIINLPEETKTIDSFEKTKVLDLSKISVHYHNGRSSVYLEDLAEAGYQILPERLGQIINNVIKSRPYR